ncbi:MAG: VWA domain-containing protein [Nitrospirales bacterium]|nr:VWA domain-containing protein [Nitrospira sp.]MDR4460395.1 VWA domain-containing protein [Nitrospirales bacterium]MDR4482326.1 VWA domain-containing protein [Nitrospirales bacterium]
MITFAWPWVLAFVPFPWMVRRWAAPVSKSAGRAMKVPHFEDIMALQSNQLIGSTRSRHSTLFWAGIFIWTTLLLAAARPQWSGEPVGLPTSGRDLMLAVDVSGSMKIPDFSVNGQEVTRLEVVKAAAGDFIAGRTGDRLGLIVFGSQAYVQTPLTFDRDTVKAMLAETEIGLAGQETAIGDAIGLAVKRLKEQPAGSRVLVLLTDGANTAGEVSPTQAAVLAEEQGIRIYAIGVGADRMEIESFFGTQTVNPSRDLDEDTLRHLAQRTGGLYLRAKDTEGLMRVYKELDRLEPAATETELFRPTIEFYIWPLGFALALSCVMALSFIWKWDWILRPRWKAEALSTQARAGR